MTDLPDDILMVQFGEEFHFTRYFLIDMFIGTFQKNLFHRIKTTVQLILHLNSFVCRHPKTLQVIRCAHFKDVPEASATNDSSHFEIRFQT